MIYIKKHRSIILFSSVVLPVLLFNISINNIEKEKILENGNMHIGEKIVTETLVETTTETTTQIIDRGLDEKQNYEEYNAIVSYYTYLPECTGSGLGITASGKKVSETSVAIPRKDNVLKFGTKIEFKTLAPQYMKDYNSKYLTRIADDTGNSNYIRKMEDGTYRLDVFCPKLPNETDKEYHKRVYSYGKTETKIKVYK